MAQCMLMGSNVDGADWFTKQLFGIVCCRGEWADFELLVCLSRAAWSYSGTIPAILTWRSQTANWLLT